MVQMRIALVPCHKLQNGERCLQTSERYYPGKKNVYVNICGCVDYVCRMQTTRIERIKAQQRIKTTVIQTDQTDRHYS